MQNLSIGIQSFESLRSDGFAYVDKTKPEYYTPSVRIDMVVKT